MIGYFKKSDYKELISVWRRAMKDYDGFDKEIIYWDDDQLMDNFTAIKFIRDIGKQLAKTEELK